MKAILTAVCVFTGFLAEAACADGLIQSLPPDGSWVTFETRNELSGPAARDSVVHKLWMNKAIGLAEHDGKPCRWIEVKEKSRRPGSSWWLWNRFLIPQDAFKGHGPSTDQILQHWHWSYEKELAEGTVPVSHPRFRQIFPGFLTKLEYDDEKRIEYQDGMLISTKRLKQEYSSTDDQSTTRIHYTLWLHPDVPFGVAAATVEVKRWLFGNPQYTWRREFKLKAFGTGAVSELDGRAGTVPEPASR